MPLKKVGIVPYVASLSFLLHLTFVEIVGC